MRKTEKKPFEHTFWCGMYEDWRRHIIGNSMVQLCDGDCLHCTQGGINIGGNVDDGLVTRTTIKFYNIKER